MQNTDLASNARKENPFKLKETDSKMNISDVFAERNDSYLNEFNLFRAYFNAIPNFIHEIKIDCKKANTWFSESFKKEINHFYYDKLYFDGNKKAELNDIFYFLYDDLIVNFETNRSIVRFLFNKTELAKVEEIITQIQKFKIRRQKEKPEILLLMQGFSSVVTKAMRITKPKLGIEDNYNGDFKEIHHLILKNLSKKNNKGIVLGKATLME